MNGFLSIDDYIKENKTVKSDVNDKIESITVKELDYLKDVGDSKMTEREVLLKDIRAIVREENSELFNNIKRLLSHL